MYVVSNQPQLAAWNWEDICRGLFPGGITVTLAPDQLLDSFTPTRSLGKKKERKKEEEPIDVSK